MDPQKALETVAKLHQEKEAYHRKKIKAKRVALISLIVGSIFLICFIVFISLTANDFNFTAGRILSIVFAVLAFIFLELAIVAFMLMKCVYTYQEMNRAKLLEYIDKEVNKKANNK